MIHSVTIMCLAIFSLFLSGYPITSVAISEQEEGSFKATVTVTDHVLNTVRPLIFGDNIEWVNDGMGIWLSQEKRFDDKLVEELRTAGITHLRYPGGTLSDYFDWYKAIGEERQPITNPFADHRKQYPHFGPEEYMMLCRALGIPGTITFNAGTGKPEDAGSWAKYLRDKDFQVAAFAVGNEIYMAKPEEPIAKTVEQYIDFYLKCKEAVDAVAPDVKLGAIGLHDTGAITLSQNRNWIRDILRGIGDKIDFIDIHNGYAPVTRGIGFHPDDMYPDDQFALCFMGASVYVQDNIAATKDDLARYAPDGGEDIEIHITEYGPLVYPIKQERAIEDLAWNRSLAGALYQACLFNVFLKEPKITSANHLPLCQDIFGALVGIRGIYPERKNWRNVVYYVFQMYAKMADREVMDTEVESPTYSTPSMGIVPRLDNVSYIDAGSYRTKDGNRLAIFLINRDVKRDASIKVDTGLDSFRIESSTILTSDSYKDENTPEEPDSVVPEAKVEDETGLSRTFATVLPRHSLTVIEITRM